MQFYRCKCGEQTAFGSMSPCRCSGCNECGTTLEIHPSLHRTPDPHDFYPEPVETDEGVFSLSRCRYCGRTKKEIELENR
jgi:hypothetical protein